jgi:hypothetical protein
MQISIFAYDISIDIMQESDRVSVVLLDISQSQFFCKISHTSGDVLAM